MATLPKPKSAGIDKDGIVWVGIIKKKIDTFVYREQCLEENINSEY